MRFLSRIAANVSFHVRMRIRDMRVLWHVVPAYFDHCMGRWYVFRNMPQWVVTEVATQVIRDEDGPEMAAFIREGRSELFRRLNAAVTTLGLELGEGHRLVQLARASTHDAIQHVLDTENRAARKAATQPRR